MRQVSNIFGNHFHELNNIPNNFNGNTVRIHDCGCCWANIEKTKGTYDFTKLDDLVNKFIGMGKEIIYVFAGTPKWATTKPNRKNAYPETEGIRTSLPDDINDLWNFVTIISSRYKGKITLWETWNEIDQLFYYSSKVKEIKNVMKKLPLLLKSIDPNNLILSPSVTLLPKGIVYFLRISSCFKYCDIINIHIYNIPFAVPEFMNVELKLLNVIKGITAWKKPLWVTELGFQMYRKMSLQQLYSYLFRQHILYTQSVDKIIWYAYDNRDIKDGSLLYSNVSAYDKMYSQLNNMKVSCFGILNFFKSKVKDIIANRVFRYSWNIFSKKYKINTKEITKK